MAVVPWQLMAEQSADAVSINEAGAVTSLSLPEWSESLIKAFSSAKRRTSCHRLLCVGGRRATARIDETGGGI